MPLEVSSGRKRVRPISRSRNFDADNLRCARLILSDRSRYEREGAGVVAWAEAVIERLEPDPQISKGEQNSNATKRNRDAARRV